MSYVLRLLSGPALAFLGYGAGGGSYSVAVLFWMATWWFLEAVPLAVTALLPLVVFPMVGLGAFKSFAIHYAAEVIFLFLGGFMLAAAIEKWGLQNWMATRILRVSGTKPHRVLAAFMGVTALASMWVSNSAAALMMLPLARSFGGRRISGTMPYDATHEGFSRVLLVGIAYGASIGGVGTLIGSPPNALFAAYAQSHGTTVTFASWLVAAAPVVIIGLPFAWYWLATGNGVNLFRLSSIDLQMPQGQKNQIEKLTSTQIRILAVFFMASIAWIGHGLAPQASALTDAAIGLCAGIMLFALPSGDISSGNREPILVSADFEALPWGVLLLFGGGLALSSGLEKEGITQRLAAVLIDVGAGHPVFFTVLFLTLVSVLTSVASNTAIAALVIPLVGALGTKLATVNGMHLAMGAALASSMAFLFPVSTPPNAVVYSTGLLKMTDMVKAGWVLNLFFVILIALLVRWWLPLLG
jgi:sodium-dependent dicarboxylate transporter 2/3/5